MGGCGDHFSERECQSRRTEKEAWVGVSAVVGPYGEHAEKSDSCSWPLEQKKDKRLWDGIGGRLSNGTE